MSHNHSWTYGLRCPEPGLGAVSERDSELEAWGDVLEPPAVTTTAFLSIAIPAALVA